MNHNIPALLEVIKFIYNNIMYAEINTKSCYCEKCGYDGDIPLVADENNKLKWECPNCGNTDNTTMDIAFRVCGYIGTAKMVETKEDMEISTTVFTILTMLKMRRFK